MMTSYLAWVDNPTGAMDVLILVGQPELQAHVNEEDQVHHTVCKKEGVLSTTRRGTSARSERRNGVLGSTEWLLQSSAL